ncbi:MAG: tRNA lysidine(34) synthetase TilS [Provencibacterium sp.]|jgi:tRNA(Ile)-lysidine synthase|nr:tRNA lysidine(34) synthetase TilS [Provencibacterium sp.]
MNKIIEAVERHQMLKQGEAVVVGVSGGADSTALLDFLCRGLPEWGLRVFVCHINHRLRGDESDGDEAFVRQLCRRYSVKLFSFTEEIAAQAVEKGQSIELAAREIRYQRFEELAGRLDAKIATAHTLSDSMETMLYHLARGTGLRGLSGIPPVRGRIIRPLIGMTRQEVESYLAERGLDYRTDSSNLTDAYTRNRIRHRLIPELYQLNPHADAAAVRLQTLLRETEDYLDSEAGRRLENAQEGEAFWFAEWETLPMALRRAVLVRLLREYRVEPEFVRVERMLAGIADGRCCIELRRGLFFVCKGQLLSMQERHELASERPENGGFVPVPFPIEGNIVQIQNKTIRFLCDGYEHFKNIENIPKSLLKNLVDYDKIGDNVVVRTRRAGDCFSHPERRWTKPLKKLFNEYHIPPEERLAILVCADDKGVFWVEGFGADARVSPGRETKRFLEIKRVEESGRCRKTF